MEGGGSTVELRGFRREDNAVEAGRLRGRKPEGEEAGGQGSEWRELHG